MNTGQTGRPRKHARARIGDRFGDRTVTALLRTDSTCNERVEWKCTCGVWGNSYVFNLRNNPSCGHRRKSTQAPSPAVGNASKGDE